MKNNVNKNIRFNRIKKNNEKGKRICLSNIKGLLIYDNVRDVLRFPNGVDISYGEDVNFLPKPLIARNKNPYCLPDI
ncbi:MAG: hypothetical protein ACP5D2_00400 [Candidatus Nanoarchaeia archaeon]